LYRLILCCVLLIPLPGQSQVPPSRYIILFTDKKGSPQTLADPGAYLSTASLQRRAKQQIRPDSTDLPLSAVYLDSIAGVPNVTILNRSKWLNQVLIGTTDSVALAAIRHFRFVRRTFPVGAAASELMQIGHGAKFPGRGGIQGGGKLQAARGKLQAASGKLQAARAKLPAGGDAGTGLIGGDLINYGNSFAQIHIHHGEYLHNLGFRGQGMTIAVIDDGFSGYLNNPVFDSILSNGQVLGSWDFVNNKQSVNEEDIHGMYCLSIMAADRPGSMVGSAPGAKFWLFKTEDLHSEYPVEEQNWAAAAEFADSVGADVITTSLGYVDFDDPALDHSYAERDGHEAISSRAANFAVAKGMIVLASAGNSGSDMGDTKFVGCPGDGDSVLTVGATDIEGRIAAFSSWGPNSAGRIKPDVVSVGIGTTIATLTGEPGTGNGTSFSTPNLAGLIACLWQAFPELSNTAVRNAIQESANQYLRPDGRYGYGLPDMERAYALLQEARGVNAIVTRGAPWITAFPVPYTDDLTIVFRGQLTGEVALTLVDALGRTIEKQMLSAVVGQWYTIHFASAAGLAAGVYFIRYSDGGRQAVLQVIRK
jgi:serine protease AprX